MRVIFLVANCTASELGEEVHPEGKDLCIIDKHEITNNITEISRGIFLRSKIYNTTTDEGWEMRLHQVIYNWTELEQKINAGKNLNFEDYPAEVEVIEKSFTLAGEADYFGLCSTYGLLHHLA